MLSTTLRTSAQQPIQSCPNAITPPVEAAERKIGPVFASQVCQPLSPCLVHTLTLFRSAAMSSIASSNDNATVTEESPKQAKSGIWQIDLDEEDKLDDSDMDLAVEQLSGTCPIDQDLWIDHTQIHYDVRGLAPFTMRFRSTKSPSSVVSPESQGEVRRAVWRKIVELLGPKADAKTLPAVMFDECATEHGHQAGVIDLVFSDCDTLVEVTGKLETCTLEIKDGDHASSQYLLQGVTNSLGGEIFVVECLRLPITTANAKDVHEAFAAELRNVGTVLGIGKLVTSTRGRKVDSGTSRIYIKIHEENMALPWRELLQKLPTSIKWQGYPYNLTFAGKSRYRSDTIPSRPSPVATQNNTSAEEAEIGPSGRRAGATDGASAPADAQKKKRRRPTNFTSPSSFSLNVELCPTFLLLETSLPPEKLQKRHDPAQLALLSPLHRNCNSIQNSPPFAFTSVFCLLFLLLYS